MLVAALLAAACTPFGGVQTNRVARGADTVTEFFAGAYRVTRCDAQGRPRRSTTMARILTPTALAPYVAVEEETARTRVFLLYGDPDEPGWARAWLESGSSATRDVVAPAAPVPADLDVRPALTRADDSCRNGAYRTFNRWRTRRYAYRINPHAHVDDGLPPGRGPRPPRLGPHAQPCGYRDQDNITSRYLGRTAGSIHTRPDGRSVVDRGRLAPVRQQRHARRAPGRSRTTAGGSWRPTSATAAAGAGRRGGGAATTTSRAPPSTRPATRSASATSASSRYLTMYHQLCAGCTFARTLGRGDVLGLRKLY